MVLEILFEMATPMPYWDDILESNWNQELLSMHPEPGVEQLLMSTTIKQLATETSNK